MGKATGFLEFDRTEASGRSPEERIRDWDEFMIPQQPSALLTQAARCMDCGVPFCHAAFLVDGGSIGCPLSNLIPEINDLVYRGETEEAFHRLLRTHPFPEFTSRVCPDLCEGSCTLGEHEPPVTIKEIERFIIDEMLQTGKRRPRVPQLRTGRRVAVVGSGPSGLACADLLNQLGHTVTVFERADRPGGLLMYGIPNMKLDKELVLGRIRLMEEEGVVFRLGEEIGVDAPALALMQDFDALVLCCGATSERTLQTPGGDLEGVMTALRFLTLSTKSLLAGRPVAGLPDLKDKNVIVVGGGDTGTDCVATSIRRGAARVTQLEIMPRLPEERGENNPWPLWPRVHKTDYGQKEAIFLSGEDPREYLTTVREIVGAEGRVTGVQTVSVDWEDRDGRLTPKEIPGTETLRPADLVLIAMGFTGPERNLIDQLSLTTDSRGNVATPAGGYGAGLLSVFAAGDMRRGPSLVVWAIDEGRRAARECHDYLSNR